MVYLHLFENENDFNNERNNNYIEPWVSATNTGNNTYRTDYNKYIPKELKEPLAFEITSDGNIVWKANYNGYTRTIEYKKNNGDWTSITSTTGGTSISVNSGDTVQFRGDNVTYSYGDYRYNTFSGTTAGFKVKNNIMSLIDSTEFTTATTLESAYTFYLLFAHCTGLTDGSRLILPSTTLIQGCYDTMFRGCTSLTSAPELPATTLANSCYVDMFGGCTSLTTAPELPATTLASQCYYNMFNGCANLNYIKCLATDISATNCVKDWVTGVQTTSGTFVKAASMTSWSTGANGIPTNWTVQDAS